MFQEAKQEVSDSDPSTTILCLNRSSLLTVDTPNDNISPGGRMEEKLVP